MQERTHYRSTADSALSSPCSVVPWADRIEEHLWRLERDAEIPAPKLADRWKSGVWLGKSDVTDEHLVRTDDEVVYARSVRRLAENSWSEENFKSVIETPQNPRSTTTHDAADHRAVPEVHEHENQDEEANDNVGEDEESPDKPDDEEHDMEPDTTATLSSSRGEKRTETQENVFVKRR